MDSMGQTSTIPDPCPSPRWKYDVFLSFRGEDTRTGITDQLYKALSEKGIVTFRDDEELKKGKSISPELLKAIEESRISVIILSRNYASSTWCLDELAKIVECMESGLLVLPLFYLVEPSEVRKQHTGNFRMYFAEHEQKFKDDKGKVDKWRKALTQVANISGWELKQRHETKVVQEIVEHIFSELNYLDFVGLDRVKKIELELSMELAEVCVIGICGMPGVGKTSIAKVVSERIWDKFDASSFIVNVGQVSKEKGLFHIQKQLYQDLLKSEVKMQNVNLIRSRLRYKRVLIILDGVNELEQIEAVAGKDGKELYDRFGRGSRIIITTRDERLLMNYGAKIHTVENLTENEALLLFCRKAFKKDHPIYGFAELSYSFVDYADGVPLALVVLGSFLLHRSIEEWSSALGRLKDNNYSGESKVSEILKVGFDALHSAEKDIFLDIACFFKGDDASLVKRIFESCGYHPGIGVNILIEKSLVSILGGKLLMHDLLQKMGTDIVRGESRKPGERSRLWLSTEALPVLRNNKGTEAVKGIFLSSPQQENIHLKADPFSEMHTLRLLKIKNMTFSGCLEFVLSDELSLFEWQGYPLKSLPSSFNPDKLVTLNLSQSRIETLWMETKKPLENLVIMNLSDCIYLTKTPDFSAVPKLESLILKGCTRLYEVQPSIGVLQQLISLNLEGCKCLTTFPHSISLKYLEIFILSGCCKLERIPEIGENMRQLSELHLDETAIKELPASIKHLTGLTILNLKDCKNVSSLPDAICTLSSLQVLNLSGCSNLQEFPEDLGSLECLHELDASRSGIRQIPSSIVLLKNLKVLSFAGCQGDHLDAPPNSWCSILINCCLLPSDSAPSNCNSNSIGLQLLTSFSGLCSLERLDLSNCNLWEGAIPDDIGYVPLLNYLNLSGNYFESLPDSISKLSQLQELRLKDCSNLKALPQLPSGLRSISAQGCPLLGTKDGMLWTSASHGFTFIHFSEGEDIIPVPPISEKHIYGQYLEKLFVDYIHRDYQFDYFSISDTEKYEIPKWFRRSSGSSIRIPLPPDFDCNSRWMGVALFVSYELHGNVDETENQREWEEAREGILRSSYQYSCHIYTNDDDSLESPLVRRLNNCRIVGPGSYQYWFYIPRRELAKRLNKGSIRAEIIPEANVKECGARLIYSDDVPNFIQSLVQPYSPADHDVIVDYKLRNPDKSISTKCFFSGPSGIFQKEKNSTDQLELLKQVAELIPSHEPTPFFIEIEPPGYDSSSTKIVGELRRNIELVLHQLFEGGNAGYYDYGFTVSPRVKAIFPWFSDQSVGSEVRLPHSPPDLYKDKTWLGLSVYAAFIVSPGSTFSCACYLITVTGEYLVRLVATCIVEDESSGSQRICIIHIPRARFPEQWNQCGQVFASFDVLIPGGKKDADVCGVRLVYEQDLKGLIQTITNCTISSPPVYYGRDNRTEKMQPSGHSAGITFMNASLVEIAKSRNYSKPLLEKCGIFPLQRSLSTFPQPSGFISVDQEIHLSIRAYTPLKQNRDSVIEWKRNLDLLLQSLLRVSRVSVTLRLGREDNYSMGSFDPYSMFSTTFPGTKIPEWFGTEKYLPSSKLMFPLPPNLENNEDWMGIVACVSFSVHASPADVQSYLDSDVHPKLTCHFQCCEEHDNLFLFDAQLSGSAPENKFMWLYLRGFIWLHYIPRVFMTSNLNLEHRLLASFTSDSSQVLGVHRCGLRILYKQDMQELKQTIISCFTSFFDKEDLIRQYFNDVFQDHHRNTSPNGNRKDILLDQNQLLDFDCFLTYNSCFPPNEITLWFKSHSFGPEISMPLPPNLDGDANWIGLAFYVSFSVLENAVADLANNLAPGISHHLTCFFETSKGSLQSLHDYCTTNKEFQWLHLGGFIWLSYILRKWFADQLNECGRLEASIVSGHGAFSVEKCGFRLVYQQDEEELKQTIMLCMTSLPDNDIKKLDHDGEAAGTSGVQSVVYDQLGGASTTIGNNDKEFDRGSVYNFCFPPNDIVEWFGHHNDGPSVTMLLPSNLYGDATPNWIGVAFCAYFEVLDRLATNLDNSDPGVPHHLTCYFETDGGSLESIHDYSTFKNEFQWLHLGGFIWLSYIPRAWFLDQLNECGKLEASITSDHQTFNVRKCGIHRVYQHDVEEFKKTIMHCITSLSEHDNRKNKQYPEIGGEAGSSGRTGCNNIVIEDPQNGSLEGPLTDRKGKGVLE